MVKRAALALGLLAGCTTITDLVTTSFDTNDFSGDEFPTTVQRAEGAVIVGVKPSDDSATHTAVLDILSPITVIDHGADTAPSIGTPDLTLLGVRAATGALDLPRGKFVEPQVVTLHPCKDATCVVGTDAGQRTIDAVVGMSVFESDALRLRLHDDQIFILPDIAGSDDRRSKACDAVFDAPFRGGGTLLVGNTEVDFPNVRVAIDACLDPHPDTPGLLQPKRGTDVLLVASTGIGPSLLGESAYERYREPRMSTTLPSASLPQKTVYLPSGPVTGGVALIPSIALVANWDANPRAPCRQVYTSHFMAVRNCVVGDTDCPCDSPDTFCSAPAIVELAPQAMIEVIVVPDSEGTLQALRTELRPDRPEVDGILGANALADIELDVDFPHGRLLGRCTGDDTVCKARPRLPSVDLRDRVNACLGATPGPIQ